MPADALLVTEPEQRAMVRAHQNLRAIARDVSRLEIKR
jgi:hypothetical protein